MANLSRRSALTAALWAAGTGPLIAQQAQNQSSGDQSSNDNEMISRRNAINFWSRVSRDLISFDHSISRGSPEEIRQILRAPGPVASARALGVIHVVLADSLLLISPQPRYAPYRSGFKATETISNGSHFIGGAASTIIRHIYDNNEHLNILNPSEAEFIRQYSSSDSEGDDSSWRQGQDFAYSYKDLWDGQDVRDRINPQDTTYQPEDGKHQVDPTDQEQGYYGQSWGVQPSPLSLDEQQVQEFCPPPPDEIPRDQIDEVRNLGKLTASLDENGRLDVVRTPEQEQIGIFWAYDGARFLGTPPRMFNQIISEIARHDDLDDQETARLLALCNIAMSDAGNVAWWAKYNYAIWRPIVGIRNDKQTPDGSWFPLGAPKTNRADFTLLTQPQVEERLDVAQARLFSAQDVFLGGASRNLEVNFNRSSEDQFLAAYREAAFTPNFPAYPSGHATFGAACFEVVRLFKEEIDGSPDEHSLGVTVSSDEWNGMSVDNFQPEFRPKLPTAAKNEPIDTVQEIIEGNNVSRIHLGVHWRMDATSGETAGNSVAGVVFNGHYRPSA